MILESLLALCLIGDSYTSGVVSEPIGPSYAERLEELLPMPIENLGVGTTTTGHWLPGSPLYQYRVLPCLPGQVSILLGTVDAYRLYTPPHPLKTTPAQYRANIDETVSQLLADGATTIYLSIPPDTHFQALPDVLAAYREHILDICEESEVDAIICGADLSELLEPWHFAPFNIHPNGEGHRLIAEELARIVPEPRGLALVAVGILLARHGAICRNSTARRVTTTSPK